MSEELSEREKELLAKYARGRLAKRWKKVVAQRLAEQFAGEPDAGKEPAPGPVEGAAEDREGESSEEARRETRPSRRRGTSP